MVVRSITIMRIGGVSGTPEGEERLVKERNQKAMKAGI
jgi:hypothetical protein